MGGLDRAKLSAVLVSLDGIFAKSIFFSFTLRYEDDPRTVGGSRERNRGSNNICIQNRLYPITWTCSRTGPGFPRRRAYSTVSSIRHTSLIDYLPRDILSDIVFPLSRFARSFAQLLDEFRVDLFFFPVG